MSSMSGYGSSGRSSGLSGTGYKQVSTPNLSPEQMGLFQQLMGGSQSGIGAGLGHLSNQAQGGNEEYWNQLEAPAKKEFGQYQSDIANRFSQAAPGASSARRSSGHQNAQNSAAADFAERLASNRMGLQQNAISQLLGIGQNLLGTSLTSNYLLPKKKPFWQELLGSASGGIGQGAGYMLGNQLF